MVNHEVDRFQFLRPQRETTSPLGKSLEIYTVLFLNFF